MKTKTKTAPTEALLLDYIYIIKLFIVELSWSMFNVPPNTL